MPLDFLSIVEAVFEISGRGCIIVPSVRTVASKVRRNDKILLKTPAGKVLDTHVHELEIACPGAGVGIELPSGIAKDEIPEGTEIWLNRQGN